MNNFPLIIIDESTDARIAEALMNMGYEIFSIQQQMQGANDRQVIDAARERNGYILTEDKDFGDEIVFKRAINNGAMLLRLAGIPLEERIRLLVSVLQKHQDELVANFAVLKGHKLRIRK